MAVDSIGRRGALVYPKVRPASRPEPMAGITAVRQFWQNGRSTTTKQRTHTRKTGYLHKEKSEICPARLPAPRSVPCEPRAPPPSRRCMKAYATDTVPAWARNWELKPKDRFTGRHGERECRGNLAFPH